MGPTGHSHADVASNQKSLWSHAPFSHTDRTSRSQTHQGEGHPGGQQSADAWDTGHSYVDEGFREERGTGAGAAGEGAGWDDKAVRAREAMEAKVLLKWVDVNEGKGTNSDEDVLLLKEWCERKTVGSGQESVGLHLQGESAVPRTSSLAPQLEKAPNRNDSLMMAKSNLVEAELVDHIISDMEAKREH